MWDNPTPPGSVYMLMMRICSSLKTNPITLLHIARTCLSFEACIADIWQWMHLNGLKLNDSKITFLWNTVHRLIHLFPLVFTNSPRLKWIEIRYYSNTQATYSTLCKSEFYQFHMISHIWEFFPLQPLTKLFPHWSPPTWIIATVLLPDCLMWKYLPICRNFAAQLIFHSKKFDNIMPSMSWLHWFLSSHTRPCMTWSNHSWSRI